MGESEPYIRKNYSHYMTRHSSEDLTKINKDIGLGGRVIPDGEDFTITDVI
tara:strand:- start:277 stop:429 length:153 start_codon:yes stop_codon:yes gene_type:complete